MECALCNRRVLHNSGCLFLVTTVLWPLLPLLAPPHISGALQVVICLRWVRKLNFSQASNQIKCADCLKVVETFEGVMCMERRFDFYERAVAVNTAFRPHDDSVYTCTYNVYMQSRRKKYHYSLVTSEPKVDAPRPLWVEVVAYLKWGAKTP